MYKDIVAITYEKHKNKKLKPIEDFQFVLGTHLVSIMAHEFSRAASTYPIVFLEDKQNDSFKSVVMLGLQEGENLFLTKDYKWDASYIPAIIRRYPFALVKANEDNRYVICIDEASDLLNDEEGEPLFTEDGQGTKLIENVKKYLSDLQSMDLFTNEFTKYLKENNLFTPLNMKVKIKDEIKSVSGAYVINEERLNSLSNEKFIELREKSYLPVIYSHLSSLSQIERLLKIKNKTEDQNIERF